MHHSTARVSTEHASTYLQQLCKHFAHKRPVEFTPSQGTIAFEAGTCRLAADDGVLVLAVEAGDEGRLAQVQDVMERHLVRFAFREPLSVAWNRAELPHEGSAET